jgi:UDP-N-acetylmuramoylalanine--D-glutamate ligase
MLLRAHCAGLKDCRIEKINEIKKIEFFDDSKGTNVGATVAALAGMQQPVVLIAGGDGKGQDFSPLSAVVKRARAVVLIGRDAGLIERAIASTGVTLLRAGDMSDAVDVAFRVAQAGDAVLLSPACASYDMFRSYVHRAEVFVDAVAQLKRREG